MALNSFYTCLVLMLHLFMMYLSCRYHPHIFRIYYTLIAATYGLGIIDTGEGGIHQAYFSVLMVPMYVYLFMGSLTYFIIQVIIQAILVEKYYTGLIEDAATFMTPQAFARAMKYSCHITTMYFVILVVLTHVLMHQAYLKLLLVDKQKSEVENQKTFLLSFSHELRNLLNSLTGNVKLASLENLSERAKELLLNADVCGELLLHLVNNILDTGKVEIGELEITPAPTRIFDTFERIWGVCSELIKRKGLNGHMLIENNIPSVMLTDHYRLTQIFLNLVGNAIKFTESGSINMNIEWIDGKVVVDEKCFQPYPFNDSDDQDEGIFEKKQLFHVLSQNLVTLSIANRRINRNLLKKSSRSSPHGILKVVVRDTGCGMPKDSIDKLFQKFTQLTSDASKKKLGTGLGLFITRQICQRMNGQIRVFSKEGKGTSFIFCIPVTCGPPETDHSMDLMSIERLISSKRFSAMLVDDLAFNHTILSNYLDRLKIEVKDIAKNGLEAYQKYKRQAERKDRPHIVTMDLNMPIMDGKESAMKIRQFEADKGLDPCFLVIISGNCTDSETRECLDKNGKIRADGFLKKPVNVEDLLRVIGNNLGQLRS